MRRVSRYLRTALALVFTAALLAAAMLVPDIVSGWYDNRVLGQVQYADMNYEPYEIVAYTSFEEELRAICACQESGFELTEVGIDEGGDAPEIGELLALVNREFGEMYRCGLLGEELVAEEILERKKVELYSFSGHREVYPKNVCYWSLYCQTPDGSIDLTLDCEFHKVYNFRCYKYTWSNAMADKVRAEYMSAWTNAMADRDGWVQDWYDYWGVDGGGLQEFLMYYLHNDVTKTYVTEGLHMER